MPDTINVGSGGAKVFKATELGTTQRYSLSAATSPLVLTPPAGKVIRLDVCTSAEALTGVSIQVGSKTVISGNLYYISASVGHFDICSNSAYGSSSASSTQFTGSKEPILATQPDESISIYCTDNSTSANNLFYSVTYGDFE